MKTYYLITPDRKAVGPFPNYAEALREVPETHNHLLHYYFPDRLACEALLPRRPATHVSTWVPDRDTDPDEDGYFIFRLTSEPQ